MAPVWFIVEDEDLIFNTGKDTVTGRFLARERAVAICIAAPDVQAIFRGLACRQTAGGFRGNVTRLDGAWQHHPAVHTAQPQLPAGAGVDKTHRLGAKALDEFRAAEMRGVADLQHGPADREQAARREVVHAEIEVDVELVTSQRHPVPTACHKLGYPGVHHRHLPLRVG